MLYVYIKYIYYLFVVFVLPSVVNKALCGNSARDSLPTQSEPCAI